MVTNFATTQPYTNITHGKKQIQLINDKDKKEQKIKITINYKQNSPSIRRKQIKTIDKSKVGKVKTLK